MSPPVSGGVGNHLSRIVSIGVHWATAWATHLQRVLFVIDAKAVLSVERRNVPREFQTTPEVDTPASSGNVNRELWGFAG